MSIAEDHVVAERLGHTFAGGVEALREIRLRLRPGDFVSIVGPSGCGKSTLLRLVAGLLPCPDGVLRINGMDPVAARRRTELAFVFQAPTLLPWRTVEANVGLPLELQGRSAGETRARVAEVVELVGLSEFRRARPHQLSGGMQMRVSLARALATRPQLLLLDEPFGALDDITRQRLNEELLALWGRDRFTALFVTHNVVEAAFLGSRVLVMSGRPGTFRHEIEVPFPYPRVPALRGEPAFARLCGEIGRLLREGYR